MTDNEIIKELQCASEWFTQHGSNTNTAIIGICGRAVDLIKHQQAEIKRLKCEAAILSENADSAFQDGLNEAQDLYASQIRGEARAEAIKDYAERLKNLKHECGCNFRKKPVYAVTEDQIDNLVKEMTGEQE